MAQSHCADDIPAVLKGGFPSFSTPLPESCHVWTQQQPALREQLWRLMGDLPPLFTPEVTILEIEARDGFEVEKLSFDNGIGDTVSGYLLLPSRSASRKPAILYHHYHGGKYSQGKEELLKRVFVDMGNSTLVSGEELARAGYVVLAIDAYGFGQRQYQGPAGVREQGGATEASLFKTFLWEGRTLWGMMVRDDRLALNYLLTRPEIDPQRVATMGMSMGATRSWWLAALDERIKVVVSVACLTRYQDLIAAGEVRRHGFYYYVPGLLKERIDTETIIGLIAPRAHLTLTGERDEGSPSSGVRTINRFQESLYRLYGRPDRFRGVLYPGLGHVYTPEMWRETLDWLAQWV